LVYLLAVANCTEALMADAVLLQRFTIMHDLGERVLIISYEACDTPQRSRCRSSLPRLAQADFTAPSKMASPFWMSSSSMVSGAMNLRTLP
jgi:hypothetical protein